MRDHQSVLMPTANNTSASAACNHRDENRRAKRLPTIVAGMDPHSMRLSTMPANDQPVALLIVM